MLHLRAGVPQGLRVRAGSPPREHFIVAPGHEQTDVEVVVERHRSYVVVSKADLVRLGR